MDRSEQLVLGGVQNNCCNSILNRFIIIVCGLLGEWL